MGVTVNKVEVKKAANGAVSATWTKLKYKNKADTTKEYTLLWQYTTNSAGSKWYDGEKKTVEQPDAANIAPQIYTPPENATYVRAKVKPIAADHKVTTKKSGYNKNEVVETTETKPYYTSAQWSVSKKVKIPKQEDESKKVDDVPVPTVSLNTTTSGVSGVKLTMSVSTYGLNNVKKVQFQVYKNDNKKVLDVTVKPTKTKIAKYIKNMAEGASYKVRARGINGQEKGKWSEFSEAVATRPSQVSELRVSALGTKGDAVALEWDPVPGAKSYEIEYTRYTKNFGTSEGVQSITKTGWYDDSIGVCRVEIRDLDTTPDPETGEPATYYFRIRAKGETDSEVSKWSEHAVIQLGVKPAPPTTWSNVTKAVEDETVMLYWLHNASDGSKMYKAELEISYEPTTGDGLIVISLDNELSSDSTDVIHSYTLDPNLYKDNMEGSEITWRVRTTSKDDDSLWSEWSVERVIEYFAPPWIEMAVRPLESSEVLKGFPFYIDLASGPYSQQLVEFYVSIIALDDYETENPDGSPKYISAGTVVYSRYMNAPTDAGSDEEQHNATFELTPSEVDLENGVSYGITATCTMDSGLSETITDTFTVDWAEEEYYADAEIYIDYENGVSAQIVPVCYDLEGNVVDSREIMVSVYRRDFDGKCIAISTDASPGGEVTDPHPALDYARYRIVARSEATGAISYTDIPGEPVHWKSVILQWNPYPYANQNEDEEDDSEDPLSVISYGAKTVMIPYDIDVSESADRDVVTVGYIGREHPVSYYGTQVGQKSTWNVKIPKEDKDALYLLRQLSIFQGDVYVREPSGLGYWALVNTSFSQTHCEVSVPVTFDITRVEGGM